MLSVIVPVFNEGAAVRDSYTGMVTALRAGMPGVPFELLFVDDGSSDDSFVHLKELAQAHAEVRVLKLAANVGSHMAIRAGIDHCRGDYACFIACDLQDPPDLIPQMLAAMTGPIQLVWAVRESRDDRLRDRAFSKLFYFLARRIAHVELAPGGASMAVLGPKTLDAVRAFTERNLTLDGLLSGLGYIYAVVPYHRRARAAGVSKWTLQKKLKLFADFFVGSSYAPVRAMAYFGTLVALLGFLYAIVVLCNRLFFGQPIPGWSSLMLAVLLIGGVQMLMLGVIGEYLWRTLDEARRRPRYLIEESAGAGTAHPDLAASAGRRHEGS